MIGKTKEITTFLYNHHFVRYVFVGGSTFILDIGLLILLHQGLNFNLAVATSIAYWVSIGYNFILNRTWTFSIAEKESLRRHLGTYLILLAFNYLFTVIVVSTLGKVIYFGLAKAIAVAIQMIWTYKIYKNYIFITKDS
jgi:putative flippase GtrA